MNNPLQHQDHWIEPKSLTDTRAEDETSCEFCQEDVPFHNVSCRLLKFAYKRRKSNCTFCDAVFIVGDNMFQHVTTTHAEELKAYQVPSFRTSRKKQSL